MEKQLLNILNELNEMTSTNKAFVKGIISLIGEVNNEIDLKLVKGIIRDYLLIVSTDIDKEYKRLDEIYEILRTMED